MSNPVWKRGLTVVLLCGLAAACGGDAPGADDAGAEPSGEAEPTVQPDTATLADTMTITGPGQDEAFLASGLIGGWQWISFQGMDDSAIEVEDPSKYTLTFTTDGAAIVADCNRGTAGFQLEGSALSFSPIAVTQAMCPGTSLGGTYLQDLGEVRGWTIQDGDLHLSLGADAGIMRFRPFGESY